MKKSHVSCPVCGRMPGRMYQCSHCKELRCGRELCTGSAKMIRGWASSGTQCRVCGMGRYGVIDIFGDEVTQFLARRRREKRDQEGAADLLPEPSR